MRQAGNGDTVQVHYTGTLSDGTQFDSSVGREPLEVGIGKREVIPAFEAALVGMSAGEAKTIVIEPVDAYGEHDPQLVQEIGRDRIPPEIELALGTMLVSSDAEGRQTRLAVVGLNDETVILDANHPLAGKQLSFDLTLVAFVD